MRPALAVCAILSTTGVAGATDLDWGGVTIAYDAATWRVGPHDDSGTIVFTCVAADCPGGPIVLAIAQTTAQTTEALCHANIGDDRNWRRKLSVADKSHPATGIAFAAVSRWSGCRAMDTPILEACGAHGGTFYRFTTGLGEGCNHVPEVPVDRFLDLVRGVKPAK